MESDRAQARTTRVKVVLAPALANLFPGALAQLEVEAASVADVVSALDQRWPGMRDRICDSSPRIRRHMNVFVDGERATLSSSLADGAEIYILTSVSGG